ncbi:uncharacterized protein LOC106166456 isoform X2 [Lingula anatina]|nr:uncharacterized protein LOC106166456 isoform X2 [Lingula anatina]|eukprot:XP_013400599.1 uncharacterized protein LOC106166456 isoform X2 [Lingula anatina]
MSSTSGTKTATLDSLADDLKYIDDDEDSGSPKPKPSLESLSRTSRHFASGSDTGSVSEERSMGDDSGIFNSSSKGTISSPSNDGSDSESRGVFDYYPINSVKSYTTAKSSNSKIEVAHNKAYDEAVSVDSEGTVTDSDSPRSVSSIQEANQSEGTEMTTFRISSSTAQITASHSSSSKSSGYNDDDDRKLMDNVAVHQRLYGNDSKVPYTRMEEEDLDDSGEDVTLRSLEVSSDRYKKDSKDLKIMFPNSTKYGSFSNKPTSAVDSSINFFGAGGRTCGSLNNKSSDSVRIEKTETSRPKDQPPFGDPVSMMELGQSVSGLISSKTDTDIPDLPESEPLLKKVEETGKSGDENNKKKKKKKKTTKDDAGSDSSETSKGKASYDVNGNPETSGPTKSQVGFNQRTFTQVRRSGTSTNYVRAYQRSAFPSMLHHLNEYEINQMPVSELEDMPSSSSADHSYYLKKMRKQARKEREEKAIDAKEIPGHQGNKQVDELLEFIESSGGKKKKTTSSMNNSHSLPNNLSNKARKTLTKDEKKKSLSESHDHSSSETGSDNGEEPNGYLRNNDKDKIEDYGNESDTEDLPEGSDQKNFDYVAKEETQSKVSYETVEAEYLVQSLVSTSEADSEENPPAIGSTEDSAQFSTVENRDHFIFTDIDMPQVKEDKFETVIHKKKKQRPTGVFTPPYFEHRREPRFEERRRPVRSVTPPPNSIHVASGEKQTDRALSPSAFPALPHGMGREGRRNSTGNVDTLPNQDDSDIESVKSLPVSDTMDIKSSTAPSDVVKPLPISYAKIAASPKPNPSSQVSPRVHPQPAETEQQRRHSFSHHDHNLIGSSGEGSDLKSKNDVISRSQELPTSLEKAENASVSNTGYACVVKAKRKLSDEFGVSATFNSSSSSVSGEKPVGNLAVTKTERKLGTCNNFNSSTEVNKAVPSVNLPKQNAPLASQTQQQFSKSETVQKMPKPELVSCNKRSENTVLMNSSKPQHFQNISAASNAGVTMPSVNSKKSSKNTKFLVFLDKKEGDTSNLGISFGFDENMPDMLENVPAQDIPAVDTTPDIIRNSSGGNNKQAKPGMEISFMDSCDIEPTMDRGYDVKGGIGKAQAKLNGLVAPVPMPQSVSVAMPWGKVNNAGKNAQPSFLAEDFPPITKADNKKMVTPSHKGMYENDFLGTFSIEDAASFLIREWDRLVTKDSRGVENLFFSDQWQ